MTTKEIQNVKDFINSKTDTTYRTILLICSQNCIPCSILYRELKQQYKTLTKQIKLYHLDTENEFVYTYDIKHSPTALIFVGKEFKTKLYNLDSILKFIRNTIRVSEQTQ